MEAEDPGLGAIVYDSYPPSKRNDAVLMSAGVIGLLIVPGIFWGGSSLFGTTLWTIIGFVLLIPVTPAILAYHLIAFQDRFRIYERGVHFHTFKFNGDLTARYRNNPYVERRAYRFEEVRAIHPFLFTLGSIWTTDIGLRFLLPHHEHGTVMGEICFSAWSIKKMPHLAQALKARMGPLWQSKYRPGEPASFGLLHDKDVARFVENGLTEEELGAVVSTKENLGKMLKDLH